MSAGPLARVEAALARAAAAPADPGAWVEAARALEAAGSPAAAVDGWARAHRLRPDHPDLLRAWGSALLRTGQPELALPPLQRAQALDPRPALGLNLGVAHRALGQLDAAVAALRAAAADPGPQAADAAWNLAVALLMRGDAAEGWAAYEARLGLPGFSLAPVDGPDWSGGPGPLLVCAEQGLGDTLQFCRLLRRLPAGVQPRFAVQPALLPLLEASGVAGPGGAPVPLLPLRRGLRPEDAGAREKVHLLSLAHRCGLASDPAEPGPYLRPPADRVARWADRLRALAPTGLRVGLVYQGNPRYADDARRSLPLAALRPLADLPGVTLFSLQKVHGLDQLGPARAAWGPGRLIDLGPELDEGPDSAPFVDTAAALCALDALVCSDTAPLHLAGALGVPTVALLARVPDWRFGLTGDRLPEYPRARLLRQDRAGDWSGPVARAAALLSHPDLLP